MCLGAYHHGQCHRPKCVTESGRSTSVKVHPPGWTQSTISVLERILLHMPRNMRDNTGMIHSQQAVWKVLSKLAQDCLSVSETAGSLPASLSGGQLEGKRR